MKSFTKFIAAGLVALAALTAGAPAQAHSEWPGGSRAGVTMQFGESFEPAHWRGHHGRWGRLSLREIAFLLHRRGFDHVRIVGKRGPVYRALAISPRGGRVALTVSARSGRILDIDRIGPRHHRWHDRGYGGHYGGRGFY